MEAQKSHQMAREDADGDDLLSEADKESEKQAKAWWKRTHTNAAAEATAFAAAAGWAAALKKVENGYPEPEPAHVKSQPIKQHAKHLKHPLAAHSAMWKWKHSKLVAAWRKNKGAFKRFTRKAF